MGTGQDFTRKYLPALDEEIINLEPGDADDLETGPYDSVATTTDSISPKSTLTLRSGPAALHCDCSASPFSNGALEDAVGECSKPAGVRLQTQSMEKYALEKIPSPIRIKPQGKAPDSPLDLSPPPSPKRKREADLQEDLKDVAFTAVLPAKHVDLHRSQSTF